MLFIIDHLEFYIIMKENSSTTITTTTTTTIIIARGVFLKIYPRRNLSTTIEQRSQCQRNNSIIPCSILGDVFVET